MNNLKYFLLNGYEQFNHMVMTGGAVSRDSWELTPIMILPSKNMFGVIVNGLRINYNIHNQYIQ